MADFPTLTDAIYVLPWTGPATPLVRLALYVVRLKRFVDANEPTPAKFLEKSIKYLIENIEEIAKGNIEGPLLKPEHEALQHMIDGRGPAVVVVYPMWRRDP